MSAAELAIWARSEGLSLGQVQESLWERRELVKTWCMRGTLHLLPAAEWPLWSAALSRRDAVAAAGLAEVVRPHARGDGGADRDDRHAARRGGQDARGGRRARTGAPARGVAARLGLAPEAGRVRGPPRLRPEPRPQRHLRPPGAWLGAPLDGVDRTRRCRELFRRFLRTYGPATHQDFAHWWGGDRRRRRRHPALARGRGREVEAEGRQAWVLAEDVELLARSSGRSRSTCCPSSTSTRSTTGRARRSCRRTSTTASTARPAGSRRSCSSTAPSPASGSTRSEPRRLDVRVELFVRETKRLRAGIARRAKSLGEFLELPVELQL